MPLFFYRQGPIVGQASLASTQYVAEDDFQFLVLGLCCWRTGIIGLCHHSSPCAMSLKTLWTYVIIYLAISSKILPFCLPCSVTQDLLFPKGLFLGVEDSIPHLFCLSMQGCKRRTAHPYTIVSFSTQPQEGGMLNSFS